MTKFMYIIVVITFLDTFIQLPVITPYSLELGASYALTGLIVAMYSFTNMLGNILAGRWIDEFGRKRMLLIGIITVFIILLFYPLAQNGLQLLFVRFFHGLAGGILIPAAFTYIGDKSEEKTRGKSMALAGASIGVAAIIGPAIGGIIGAKYSIEMVFYIVAGLFLITAFMVLFLIEESYERKTNNKIGLKSFLPLLKNPEIILASLSAFALMLSNGTLAFALPLNVSAMGRSSEFTGILLSSFGLVALVVFLSKANSIYDRYSPVKLIMLGLTLIGIGMIILGSSMSLAINFIAMGIYGLGFSFIFPSMNKIIADISKKKHRGRAYGVFYAFFSLGVVAGSSFSGIFTEIAGLPFLGAAVIMYIMVAIIYFLQKKLDKKII